MSLCHQFNNPSFGSIAVKLMDLIISYSFVVTPMGKIVCFAVEAISSRKGWLSTTTLSFASEQFFLNKGAIFYPGQYRAINERKKKILRIFFVEINFLSLKFTLFVLPISALLPLPEMIALQVMFLLRQRATRTRRMTPTTTATTMAAIIDLQQQSTTSTSLLVNGSCDSS